MPRLVALTVVMTIVLAGCGGDDKPTTPTPTGACCVPAGTCTVTTEAACTGTWTVGICTPNPCAQPTGSCCAVDGTCTVTLEAACISPGAWVMSGVCTPNPCTQPTGSCCAAEGTCTLILQADCVSPSAWTMSGVCDPNPCPAPPATGSCCAPSGSCTVTMQAACAGISTWTLAGVCDPNICPTAPPLSEMVWIPPGNVRLGQAGIAEPVNAFYLDGFWIDRYEVSNAKYKAFMDAGGYQDSTYWNPVGWAWRVANSVTLPDSWNSNTYHGGGIAGNEQFPVNGVSWFEADAYCHWAGKRLPTEAEWEKAAKGGCEMHGNPDRCDDSDTPTYPWGEDLTGPQANYFQSGDPYEFIGSTTPVGYYDGSDHSGYQTIDSPSPYGLYDVAGNVWEWCSTMNAAYPYNPNDGRENPPLSDSEGYRVLRGGSWINVDGLRCAIRGSDYPNLRYGSVGIRCVRTGS